MMKSAMKASETKAFEVVMLCTMGIRRTGAATLVSNADIQMPRNIKAKIKTNGRWPNQRCGVMRREANSE
jgi:hypothetical protein